MNIWRHIRRHLGALVLLLVVAAAFARLAWVASQYETGWSVVADDWRPGVLRRLGLEHLPWYQREPVAQAEFLLAEVDRLLAEKPNDAATLMGCALLLDRPTFDDYSRSLPTGDDFEATCRGRCVELAAEATSREPANLDWWRLRAQLQFRELGRTPEPRSKDWRATLAECAARDPDNALYDYLAGRQLLHDAAHVEEVIAPGVVQIVTQRRIVDDDQGESEGMEHLDRAAQKPFLAFGARGHECLYDVVLAADWSAATTLVWRRAERDLGLWPVDLSSHSNHPLSIDMYNGDVKAAARVCAFKLRIGEQLVAARPIDKPRSTWYARHAIRHTSTQFDADHPGELSADELAAAREIQDSVRSDEAGYDAVWEQRAWPPGSETELELLVATLAGPSIVPPLAALAVVLLGIATLLLRRQSTPPYRVHFMGAALIWIAVAAAILATLGFQWPGPSWPGIDFARVALAWLPLLLGLSWLAHYGWTLALRWRRGEVQHRRVHLLAVGVAFTIVVIAWLFVGARAIAGLGAVVSIELATICVVLFVLGAFYVARWLAGNRQGSAAVITSLVALGTMITGALAAVGLVACNHVYFAKRWHYLLRREGLNFFNGENLHFGALSAAANHAADVRDWLWLYNWYLYDGPLWTVVYALLLLAFWTLWRVGRARRRDPDLPPLRSAWAIGSLLRTLGLSCLVVAALCALPYLLLTPEHLPWADAYYQQVMRSP